MSNSKTKNSNDSYMELTSALKAGNISKLYIFHGEERYLLDYSLEKLRSLICTDGFDSFNYKRFDGKKIPLEELCDAVETFPAFADRTLIEVHDYDIFMSSHRDRVLEILSDLPDYVCIIFVYNTIPYKPDGRLKTTKDLLKYADVVEFNPQEKSKLLNWIKRHFADAGKNISTDDAEYLAYITGGLMTTLYGEIGKVAAYATTSSVSRADIDKIVTPVPNAVAYKLTDSIINRNHKQALRLLDELFQMREAPQKLIYSISLRIRQLLVAKVCLDRGIGKTEFMKMCDIRFDIQARTLIDTARNISLSKCCNYIIKCSQIALELNSTAQPEARMTELLVTLAAL